MLYVWDQFDRSYLNLQEMVNIKIDTQVYASGTLLPEVLTFLQV